jgi:P4 family phage/plasmid primase-like protien
MTTQAQDTPQTTNGQDAHASSDTEVTVTIFRAGEKAHGSPLRTTWADFFGKMSALTNTAKTTDKLKLPGWSAATFKDNHRRMENVENVYAVVLDFDNSGKVKRPDGKVITERLSDDKLATIDGAVRVWPDCYAFAYTSWSHSVEWPRFRLVLPYSRPVTKHEHEVVWSWVAGKLKAAGQEIDTACKDASRLWFVPARRDDSYETRLQPGSPLDVDAILAEVRAEKSRPRPNDAGNAPTNPQPSVSAATTDPHSIPLTDRISRASKYLAKMPGAVSGSGGHPTTFKAAIALVRGFALPVEDAIDLLRREYNPRCQPEWSEKELRHKIEDAAKTTTPALGAYLSKRKGSKTGVWSIDSMDGLVVDDAVGADGADANATEPAKNRPCTDLGNAERLVDRYGQDLRYCAPWDKWLVWDGTRWTFANKKQVERLAQVTVRAIYAEARDESDPDRRKALADHAKRSESNARKVAMIEQAKSLPGIPILPDELDANPWLLNVKNGTIDLKTGTLRDHRREDLITKIAGVEFKPDATCPLYDAFLERVLPDPDVRELVGRLDGYALTGVVQDHVLPIHYGGGRNGKGVKTNTLLFIMGDYGRQIPTELLMAKRGDAHPTEKTTLWGIRFAAAVETEENRSLNVAFVKQATGGDKISARRMREDFWEFEPTHKIQLSTNHRPVIRETADAIWERVILIPWTVTIPKAERDTKLAEKLKSEGSGILAKLVRACLAWQKDGLPIPDAVRAATETYREDMDVLGSFLDTCCVVRAGAVDAADRLFAAFEKWAEENNERDASQTKFGTQLKDRGFEKSRDSKTGRIIWKGLAVKEEYAKTVTFKSERGLSIDDEITDEELARSLGPAEQSEQSEPTSGFAAHEDGILRQTGNAVGCGSFLTGWNVMEIDHLTLLRRGLGAGSGSGILASA